MLVRSISIMAFYTCDVGELRGGCKEGADAQQALRESFLFILLASKTGGVLYLGGSNRSFIRNHSHWIIRWCV